MISVLSTACACPVVHNILLDPFVESQVRKRYLQLANRMFDLIRSVKVEVEVQKMAYDVAPVASRQHRGMEKDYASSSFPTGDNVDRDVVTEAAKSFLD